MGACSRCCPRAIHVTEVNCECEVTYIVADWRCRGRPELSRAQPWPYLIIRLQHRCRTCSYRSREAAECAECADFTVPGAGAPAGDLHVRVLR